MGSPKIKYIPTKEELYQLKIVENLTRIQIAQKYSVSDVTVKRWLAQYEIKSDPKRVDRSIKSIDTTKPITEYSTQTISKVKELEYRLIQETSILNDMRGLTNSHRYYFLKNGLSSIPKCICGQNVKLDLEYADEVFASFCSAECSSKWGKHTQNSYDKLNDVEYLKKLRFELGMSIENMAVELKSNVETIKKIMVASGLTFEQNSWATSPRKDEMIDARVKTRGINTYGGEEEYSKIIDVGNLKSMKDSGMTFKEISKHLGVKPSVVSYTFGKYSIPYNPTDWQKFSTSGAEKELKSYIKSIYNKQLIQSHRRKYGEYELDIYLPDVNIGFEFNGCFYHSEKFKLPNYHKKKMDYWNSHGVRVITIWEDDWESNNTRTKKFINNLLGTNNQRIYARKCDVVELNHKDYYNFLEENHMLGGETAGVRIGLVYQGNIVSVMGLRHRAGTIKSWELTRFSNTTVTGAFSKILKYFTNLYNPDSIYSLADLEIVDKSNNIYTKQGFLLEYELPPDYGYYNSKNKIIEHKFNWRKSKFSKLGIDVSGKTERILAKEYGLLRCYDSGKIMYKLTINEK